MTDVRQPLVGTAKHAVHVESGDEVCDVGARDAALVAQQMLMGVNNRYPDQGGAEVRNMHGQHSCRLNFSLHVDGKPLIQRRQNQQG